MPSLKLKSNVTEFTNQMNGFVTKMNHELPGLAFRGIRSLFFRYERELFNSQGGSGDSGAWPALSPQYKKWKDKNYPGKPIMVLTDRLKDSLTSINSDHIGSIEKYGTGYLIKLGTTVLSEDGFNYPAHWQKNKRKTIDITQEQANTMAKLVKNEIEEMARKVTLLDMVRINNPTMRIQ